MFKKTLVMFCFFFILINPIRSNSLVNKYIEIFDPKQNKVIKVTELNSQIQDMVVNWVSNIQSIHGGGIDPITDDGYAVKIPLDPAVEVHSKCLNAIVHEVYIIIPEKKPPFYGIFIDKNKLMYYAFNGDIEMLSKSLGFKLK